MRRFRRAIPGEPRCHLRQGARFGSPGKTVPRSARRRDGAPVRGDRRSRGIETDPVRVGRSASRSDTRPGRRGSSRGSLRPGSGRVRMARGLPGTCSRIAGACVGRVGGFLRGRGASASIGHGALGQVVSRMRLEPAGNMPASGAALGRPVADPQGVPGLRALGADPGRRRLRDVRCLLPRRVRDGACAQGRSHAGRPSGMGRREGRVRPPSPARWKVRGVGWRWLRVESVEVPRLCRASSRVFAIARRRQGLPRCAQAHRSQRGVTARFRLGGSGARPPIGEAPGARGVSRSIARGWRRCRAVHPRTRPRWPRSRPCLRLRG